MAMAMPSEDERDEIEGTARRRRMETDFAVLEAARVKRCIIAMFVWRMSVVDGE